MPFSFVDILIFVGSVVALLFFVVVLPEWLGISPRKKKSDQEP